MNTNPRPGGGTFPAGQGAKGQRKGLQFHAQSVAVLVLTPWFAYVIVSATVAFSWFFHSWIAIVVPLLFLLFALLLVYLHQTGAQLIYLYVGILGIVAVAAGWASGWSVNDTSLAQYYSSNARATYDGVGPFAPAASLSDAGLIHFKEETKVDLRRVRGYRARDGSVYCVAPVLDSKRTNQVQFWAVGMDCCEARHGFMCDDATDPATRTGYVLSGTASPASRSLHDMFKFAAKQATATYRLYTPDNPIFVRWVKDADAIHHGYFAMGVLSLAFAWLSYLLFSVVVAACIHWSSAQPSRSSATGY